MSHLDGSGFVLFVDLEGYSKRSNETDIAALTESLCSAAVSAAEHLGLANAMVWQCTGDGFIAAPGTNDPKKILEFVQRARAGFNPVLAGGSLATHGLRSRWGIDYGTYKRVETFGSRNIAGLGPIMAARIGSIGDGDHVLVTEEAHKQLRECGTFKDLGVATLKHDLSLRVYQATDIGKPAVSDLAPSKLRRRHDVLAEVRPALKRLSLRFADHMYEAEYWSKAKADSDLSKRKFRASVLLPTHEGHHVRVPEDRVESDDEAEREHSRFRVTFGLKKGLEVGPGQSQFSTGTTPKGLPGHCFRFRRVQTLINLPSGKNLEAYIAAVVRDANGLWGYTPDDVRRWTRRAQNFIAVPFWVHKEATLGVLSLDFDGKVEDAETRSRRFDKSIDEYIEEVGFELRILALLVGYIARE